MVSKPDRGSKYRVAGFTLSFAVQSALGITQCDAMLGKALTSEDLGLLGLLHSVSSTLDSQGFKCPSSLGSSWGWRS